MSGFQHHDWQAVDRVVVWVKCKDTYQKRVRKQIQELLQQIEQALAEAPCSFLLVSIATQPKRCKTWLKSTLLIFRLTGTLAAIFRHV